MAAHRGIKPLLRGILLIFSTKIPLTPAVGVSHTVHTFDGIFNLPPLPRGKRDVLLSSPPWGED